MEQIVENLINNIKQTTVDSEVFNLLKKRGFNSLNDAIRNYFKLALSINPDVYSGSINGLIPMIIEKDLDFIMELVNHHKLTIKPLIRPKIYNLIKSLENPSEQIKQSQMYKLIEEEKQKVIIKSQNLQKNIKEYHDAVDNLTGRDGLESKTKEQVPKELPSQYTVHLIGDLEGDATMIYSWFLQMKYIDESLNWIAPENLFVVQLGDQIDIDGRRTRTKEQLSIPDYWVIIFFDYLNWKSKGHVVSVLGNHEFLNLDLDFRYVAEEHMANREELFDKNGKIRKILERRNYIIDIGPLVCCHAGLTKGVIESVSQRIGSADIHQIIHDINSVHINMYPRNSKDQTVSVIWTREYMNEQELAPKPLGEFMQNYLESQQKSMVIGHNSYNSVFYCNNTNCSDKFTSERRLIQTDSGSALESCGTNVKVSTCLVEIQDEAKITHVSTNIFDWNCQKAQSVPNLLHSGPSLPGV